MHGHLFPIVPILEELRRRGHEVALRTFASEVERMRSLGIDAHPIAPSIEALAIADWRARSQVGAAKRAAATFCDRAELEAPDLQRAIEEEQPDALLVDIFAWGGLSAAEAWGGPWASYCPLPLPLPSRDVPPFGPGLPPARGRLGRLRDRLGQSASEIGFDRLVRPPLNALRISLGLGELDRAHDLYRKPPLLLYMSAGGFDYPRSDWPANVIMVGPCTWDPPAELESELAKVAAPLVLVTTSSDFQDDGKLVRTALSALADEPYHVIATMPAGKIRGLRLPSNATVLPFAPHAPILARAVCAITHGGMGITQKALAGGVPACVVPFGRDQFEVARRVEVAGAGSRLPTWRLRPNSLRAKVKEAIACRGGAERVAQSFAATGGPQAAASAFEKQLLKG
jgi:UDP:flavonoid glycosyltransferase YjiC (YdhE family)